MAAGLFDVLGAVIDEVTGAVPRALDRTRAQVELLQRLLAAFPCRGASPDEGGGSGGMAEVTPIRPDVHEQRREQPHVDVTPVGTVPEVDTLAIPDYDSLAASQVVPRLASLNATELADVGDYERAHRGRQTILNRVRQLQVSGAG